VAKLLESVDSICDEKEMPEVVLEHFDGKVRDEGPPAKRVKTEEEHGTPAHHR
jgi:hypothetical protein